VARHRGAKRIARTGLWGGGGLSLILLMNRAWALAALFLGATVGAALAGMVVSWVLARRSRKGMAPTCAAPGLAVEYGGWSGTSHELIFTSKAYFEAFQAANPSQRISEARIVERFQEVGG
jgi:hypothetical protein